MKRILLLPPRVTEVFSRNQGRMAKILLMALVLITALYSKDYRGTYEILVNNSIGGVLYVLFGSLFFSAVMPRQKLYIPVLIALGATCLLECIQYFRFPFMVDMARYKAFVYLFGVSFNPTDFIYYGIGALVGVVVLWVLKTEPHPCPSPQGEGESSES